MLPTLVDVSHPTHNSQFFYRKYSFLPLRVCLHHFDLIDFSPFSFKSPSHRLPINFTFSLLPLKVVFGLTFRVFRSFFES